MSKNLNLNTNYSLPAWLSLIYLAGAPLERALTVTPTIPDVVAFLLACAIGTILAMYMIQLASLLHEKNKLLRIYEQQDDCYKKLCTNYELQKINDDKLVALYKEKANAASNLRSQGLDNNCEDHH